VTRRRHAAMRRRATPTLGMVSFRCCHEGTVVW
jgi:hypothetical protein